MTLINTESSSESNFITSEEDIRRMLKSCAKCTVITNNAALILAHTELPYLHLNKLGYKKYSLIINSVIGDSKIGHWFTLLVFQNRYAVICDGLNRIIRDKDIMQNLQYFCKENKLSLKDLSFLCQRLSSQKCGYIALFFTAKASILNYFSFIKLIKMLNHGSINSKEKYIMKFVQHHFRKSI